LNNPILFAILLVAALSLLVTNIVNIVNADPLRIHNYDVGRQDQYRRCVEDNTLINIQIHPDFTWVQNEHLARTTCDGQFNDEDLAKNQYFDESPLEQLQNLFGGLFK